MNRNKYEKALLIDVSQSGEVIQGAAISTPLSGDTGNLYGITKVMYNSRFCVAPYLDPVFIAVGSGGNIIASSDLGETWSSVTSSTSRDLYAVLSIPYFDSGTETFSYMSVAVGDSVYITSQTNDLSSSTDYTYGNILYDAAFDPASGRIWAVGVNEFVYSQDLSGGYEAITWTDLVASTVTQRGVAIEFKYGQDFSRMCTVGDDGLLYTFDLSSNPPSTFIDNTGTVDEDLYQIANNGSGVWVGVGDAGSVVYSTDDAESFSDLTDSSITVDFRSVTFDCTYSIWYIGASDGSVYSFDGQTLILNSIASNAVYGLSPVAIQDIASDNYVLSCGDFSEAIYKIDYLGILFTTSDSDIVYDGKTYLANYVSYSGVAGFEASTNVLNGDGNEIFSNGGFTIIYEDFYPDYLQDRSSLINSVVRVHLVINGAVTKDVYKGVVTAINLSGSSVEFVLGSLYERIKDQVLPNLMLGAFHNLESYPVSGKTAIENYESNRKIPLTGSHWYNVDSSIGVNIENAVKPIDYSYYPILVDPASPSLTTGIDPYDTLEYKGEDFYKYLGVLEGTNAPGSDFGEILIYGPLKSDFDSGDFDNYLAFLNNATLCEIKSREESVINPSISNTSPMWGVAFPENKQTFFVHRIEWIDNHSSFSRYRIYVSGDPSELVNSEVYVCLTSVDSPDFVLMDNPDKFSYTQDQARTIGFENNCFGTTNAVTIQNFWFAQKYSLNLVRAIKMTTNTRTSYSIDGSGDYDAEKEMPYVDSMGNVLIKEFSVHPKYEGKFSSYSTLTYVGNSEETFTNDYNSYYLGSDSIPTYIDYVQTGSTTDNVSVLLSIPFDQIPDDENLEFGFLFQFISSTGNYTVFKPNTTTTFKIYASRSDFEYDAANSTTDFAIASGNGTLPRRILLDTNDSYYHSFMTLGAQMHDEPYHSTFEISSVPAQPELSKICLNSNDIVGPLSISKSNLESGQKMYIYINFSVSTDGPGEHVAKLVFNNFHFYKKEYSKLESVNLSYNASSDSANYKLPALSDYVINRMWTQKDVMLDDSQQIPSFVVGKDSLIEVEYENTPTNAYCNTYAAFNSFEEERQTIDEMIGDLFSGGYNQIGTNLDGKLTVVNTTLLSRDLSDFYNTTGVTPIYGSMSDVQVSSYYNDAYSLINITCDTGSENDNADGTFISQNTRNVIYDINDPLTVDSTDYIESNFPSTAVLESIQEAYYYLRQNIRSKEFTPLYYTPNLTVLNDYGKLLEVFSHVHFDYEIAVDLKYYIDYNASVEHDFFKIRIGNFIFYKDLKDTNDQIVQGLITNISLDYANSIVRVMFTTLNNIYVTESTEIMTLDEQFGGTQLDEQIGGENIDEGIS
jgi:hypothetical protein